MNGNFNIGDGGKMAIPAYQEPAHKKKDREMTERARDYYPNPREQELENELMNQVKGASNSGFAHATVVWPEQRKIAEQRQIDEQRQRAELSALLFNQVANQYTKGEQGEQTVQATQEPTLDTLSALLFKQAADQYTNGHQTAQEPIPDTLHGRQG